MVYGTLVLPRSETGRAEEEAGVLEDFFEGTHLSRPMIIMSVGRLDDVHRGRLRRPRGIRRAFARSLGPEPGH